MYSDAYEACCCSWEEFESYDATANEVFFSIPLSLFVESKASRFCRNILDKLISSMSLKSSIVLEVLVPTYM